MLTFDDGPDEKYTPKLLDVLRENGVKATFFVLAEKAQKYPEIIKRIISEGHEIGLHYLNHSVPLLRSPLRTRKDFKKAHEILTSMGVEVRLFRPPWGLFNPLTYYYAKANNLKVILWTQHAYDWSWWNTAENIKNSLLRKIKKGSIILLHDGRGANGAPAKTIKALTEVLPILKQQGYQFVQADDFLRGGVSEQVPTLLYKGNRHISG